MEKLEAKVEKHDADIQTLVNQVTRISTIVENSEKRRDEDMSVIKEAVQSINALKDRVSGTLSLEKDVATIAKEISEAKSDFRAFKHDIAGNLTLIARIPDHEKSITALQTKMDTIETWKDQTAGGAVATVIELKTKVDGLETWKNQITGGALATKSIVYALWLVFGTGILALGYFIIKSYFMPELPDAL